MQKPFAYISMGKLNLDFLIQHTGLQCSSAILIPFTMFFSTWSPYLVFLEPVGMLFMVYDLLGKNLRKVFIGHRCFRFWILELGHSTRSLGGQRDVCPLEDQHSECVLSGADRAWVWRGIASSYSQCRCNTVFSGSRSRMSNEKNWHWFLVPSVCEWAVDLCACLRMIRNTQEELVNRGSPVNGKILLMKLGNWGFFCSFGSNYTVVLQRETAEEDIGL